MQRINAWKAVTVTLTAIFLAVLFIQLMPAVAAVPDGVGGMGTLSSSPLASEPAISQTVTHTVSVTSNKSSLDTWGRRATSAQFPREGPPSSSQVDPISPKSTDPPWGLLRQSQSDVSRQRFTRTDLTSKRVGLQRAKTLEIAPEVSVGETYDVWGYRAASGRPAKQPLQTQWTPSAEPTPPPQEPATPPLPPGEPGPGLSPQSWLAQTYNLNRGTIGMMPQQPFKPGGLIQGSATTGIQDLSSQGPILRTVWQVGNAVAASSGIFTDSGQSLGNSTSHAVALGDVDGDGDLDAFVANYNGQANKVWLNQTAVFQPAITVCETYNYVWGYSASTNSTLFLTLKSGSTIKGWGIARTDGVGYFSGEFFDQGQRVDIAPGDTVEVSNGSVTTVEVPTITGTVDPVTDVVSGTISGVSLPVSATIDIYPAPTEIVQANMVKTVSTDASGNFSTDFSAQVDIGADYVARATYTDANGNHVHSHLYVQAVNAYEQFDRVFGYAAPGASVSITVKDSGGSTKATTTTVANSDDGYYDVSFDVDIVPGDTVEVTMDGINRSVAVADLTATIDLDEDDVSGTAPPGSTVRIYVWHLTETQMEFYPKTVAADGGGGYIADYTGVLDIGRYDSVYVTSPDDDGDETILLYCPPLACVNVTYNNVWGRAQAGATVTATLKDSGGSIKDVQVVTATSYGYYEPGFSEDVVTGDTVEVSGGGVSAVIPVQNLTADVDLAADTISGIAPTSRPMIARGWRSYAPGFLRTLASDAGGTYSLDLSSQVDLYNGYEGHVYYSQADDHKVFVHYHAPVAHVNTTYDGIWGYAPEAGASVSVTVTNGGGVKATTTVDASDTDGYFEAFYDGSVDIAPGDTVEVSTNPWSDIIAIQDIQITADPDTEIVSGTGPANEVMVVEAWDDGYGSAAVPSDGSGNYVADLSDQVDLQSGDWVRVAYSTDDGNEVYAYYIIPYVRINQSHDWVQGHVQPNVPVTATLLAPDSTIRGIGTTWSDSDGWFHTDFWDEWDDRADVQANDTVQVEAGDSFFDVFVILMTGDVDPSADTVCGQMFDGDFPAPFFVDIWGTGGDTHRKGTTDEFGSYCADYSGSLDIRDGHEAFIVYTNPDGNQVGIVRSYLRVGVGITGDWLDITTAPGLDVTATLWSAGYGEVKDTQYRTANDDGRTWPGFDADVQPGDIVEVQADGRLVSLDVVDLSASGDADTDTVSGTAPPDSYVEAEVWGHGDDHREDTSSDEFGDWDIYFGDEYDIQPGDRGRAWWDHDDGHWFQVDFVMPYIEVHFRNYDWVQGRVAPNAWVDITLRDGLGEIKGSYGDWSRGDGWFGSWCVLDDNGDCVDIAPGDTVEVVYEGGDPILIPVIEITGIVDAGTNTITGQILADDLPTDAWTDIWWTREGAGQSFTTDEFGNYFVDYSPYDVLPGHWVNIWYTNPDGHQLGALFSELRLDVDVSHDNVGGITDPGRTVTVTLRAPDSSFKEEATDTANYEGQFGVGFSDDIAPGDTVEAVTNPSTSVYIEDVTIDVDVDADTVCGTAPPDAWLQVGIHGGPWWDLAADAFGDYCADFSDEYDIQPGDEGEVRYESPEGHWIYYSFFVPYDPYVEVQQSHDWVAGRTPHPDTWVDITLKDNLGAVKGTYSDWSDGDGWFGAWCVRDEHDNCVDIVAGDTVEVVYDGGDPTVVPVVEITGSVDSVANTISGQIFADTLPAEGRAETWWTRDGADQDFTTDGAGYYTVDFSPYDVKIGHWVNIRYFNPDGNQVMAVFSDLRLEVDVGYDDVGGLTDPGRTVTLTLRAGDGSVKDETTDVADYEGQFWAGFSEDIAPGDTVEATANPETSVYIEDITIDVDVDNDTVCGTAPPDAWLQVGIHGGPWWDLAADEFGDYCADFSDEYDIQPDDRGEVRYESPEGHRLYYNFSAPFLLVNQSHDWVEGRTELPNTWVTITVSDGGGVKGTYSDWSHGDGWFGHWCARDENNNCVDIAAGDTVQVEAGDSFFDVFVIPMTGDVDASADTVCGQMFDGDFPAPFFVDIWGADGDTHREGTTDEFGNYCADYSGSLDIRDGHEAFIVYTNPDGHQVGIVRSYLQIGVGITGDWLDIATAPGLDITATLWSAGYGEVKDTQYHTTNDDGRAWPGFDADIVPGDIVEVEADGRLVSLDVVDLSASGDPDTDTVSGTAPPDSYVEASVWGHGDDHWEDTTSDEFGDWGIYFGDEFDIQPGDQGRAWWDHDDGHWFQVDFGVGPFVRVNRSHDWAEGVVHSDSPVTVTVLAPDLNPKGGQDTWSDGEGWFWASDIRDDEDNWVDIQSGDTVVVESPGISPINVFVPAMWADVESDADSTYGNVPGAPEDSPVRAEAWFGDGPPDEWTATDAAGDWGVSFAPFDVLPGHTFGVWYTNPEGHEVGIVASDLYLEAYLTYDWLWGHTRGGAVITVTLWSEGSAVKDVQNPDADEDGYFSTGFDADAVPGDTIEVETDSDYGTLFLGNLTASADPNTDDICGTAPPEHYLEVGIWGHNDSWWDELWSDPDGDWCVNTQPDFDIQYDDEGWVWYQNGDANWVGVYFVVEEVLISEVRTTNARDTSFTVSWITDIPSDGHVHYGIDPSNLNQTAYDDRGADTFDDTYYVTLEELLPNTTYYFDVVSGSTTDDNDGAHYTVTTGPTLGLPGSDTIWGQVFEEDETTLAEGTIVYITLQDTDGSGSPDEAATLSALVDETGYWSTNLGNARLADLSDYFSYSASGDQVRLEAQGAADGTGCLLVDTADDSPAADLILNVSACPIEMHMPFKVGWNFISLPVNPTTAYTAESLCDEINEQGGDVVEVDRWYASGWDGHVCDLPFNDFDIELGQGYFVKSNSESTWTVEGWLVDSGVPLGLQVGWNSIAIHHSNAYTAQSLCDEINGQCEDDTAVEVDRWYASGWDGHICDLPFNDFDIEIGKGYFVKASDACTVTPDGDEPVGTTMVSLIRDYNDESNMGNLVTDGMRWKADLLDDGGLNGSVEIAFTNPGGLRTDIIIPEDAPWPYVISWEMTWEVMPFGDTLYLMDLTGAQIQELLDQAATLYKGILQSSGITWKWHNDCRCDAPSTWDAFDIEVGGEPLDPSGVYRVVTNNFLAAGGDGWVTFAEGTNRWDTGYDMQEGVNDYTALNSPVSPVIEGRITYVELGAPLASSTSRNAPVGIPESLSASALDGVIIYEVQVTNVRDTTFNVSWTTNQSVAGEVHYGADPANLDQTAYDDRGVETNDDTHYVPLTDLMPETTYYFDVVSGGTVDDNNGNHYSVTTGPTLGLPASDTVYGQVFKSDGTTPAEGTIVYITLEDSDGSGSPGHGAGLSSLVDWSGYWNANLGNARTGDLSSYFEYSASGDSIMLLAKGAAEGCTSQTVDTSNDSPAPDTTLCYLVGDLDCDGQVHVHDIMGVASCWRCRCGDECYETRFDLDEDCDIDVVDIMLVAKHWGEACP